MGVSHIEVMGMLFVLLKGVNYRFQSHLGCLGWKVTIFAHSDIAYSNLYKEIYKKCSATDHTEISLEGQLKLEPHPHPTLVSLTGLI